MKRKLPYLFALFLSGLLLAGCRTAHPAPTWEYQVVPVGAVPQVRTDLLNSMAKNGWLFVQSDGQFCYFKRARK